MRSRTLVLSVAVASALALCSMVAESLFAQSGNSGTPQTDVVLTKLTYPIYPQSARQTRITGDVKVSLGIRRDGSIESATVVSGHPLLQQAALDSAQHSHYECRGCTDPVTSFAMFYTFELRPGSCSPDTRASLAAPPEVKLSSAEIQLQNHVEIVAESVCIIDYWPTKKVRSPKCLYLWKCGTTF
jgi:TonB family protein